MVYKLFRVVNGKKLEGSGIKVGHSLLGRGCRWTALDIVGDIMLVWVDCRDCSNGRQ